MVAPVLSGLAHKDFQLPLGQFLNEQYVVVPFVYTEQNNIGMRQLYSSCSFIKWVLILLINLIKIKPHLLITSMFGLETVVTFFASKLLRKPLIVLDEHWYWQKTLPMSVAWPVAKFIARNSVLVVSGKISRNFWKLVGLPDRELRIVYFDTSSLKPEARHRLAAGKIRNVFHKKIVLYFGRLVERKGVVFLIKAFADISKEDKDVVLIIAGDGEERGNLEKLSRDLGLSEKVYFTGFVSEDDKVSYFLACDLFVCPSITLGMPEIWGIVVNEAVSLGKPVVTTTAVGSAFDLVKHGVNGYVVPEKNVAALYRAIKTILNDANLRTSMGQASEKLSKNFTEDKVSESFGKTIESTLLRIVPPMECFSGLRMRCRFE